ncbi:MAG: DUF5694 domain-containing protein [Bacteroidota bacterium]
MKIIYFLVVTSLLPFVIHSQNNTSQVLILGTTHLANIEGFEIAMLENVITKLDTMNFEVIGIEKMSGELFYDIRSRNDEAFDGITKNGSGAKFLKIADTVRSYRKITRVQAQRNIRELLNKEPLTSTDRMSLIFNYLALTDLPSAVLHYAYTQDTSVFHTAFEKYIAGILEKETRSKNEYYSLAMPLAIKERLNRLEPIDNLQDESLLFKYYPQFMEEFKANAASFSKVNQSPVFQKTKELTEAAIETGDFYDVYAFLNSAAYKTADYNAQWKIWLNTDFKSGSDKARYYLWEMRNLNITANILNLIARNPNKKILIIIGASHTGFIEKYVRQVENITLLQFR